MAGGLGIKGPTLAGSCDHTAWFASSWTDTVQLRAVIRTQLCGRVSGPCSSPGLAFSRPNFAPSWGKLQRSLHCRFRRKSRFLILQGGSDYLVGCTRSEPGAKASIFFEQVAQSSEHEIGDRLLLRAQVVFQQLVPRDVAGVGPRNGMVHEKMRVEGRHTGGRRQRSVCLAQIVAHLARTSRSSFCSTMCPVSLSAGNSHFVASRG